MAAVNQIKKTVPLITCEIPFSQYVCKLVFGIVVLIDVSKYLDILTSDFFTMMVHLPC